MVGKVWNLKIVDRGYDKLEKKLNEVGAKIERVKLGI